MKFNQNIMKQFAISLFAGWVIGIIFTWLKLPLPAPPPIGLIGAAGLTFGAFCYQYFNALLGK